MDVLALRRELAACSQEHLLAFWDELTDDEKDQLYRDLRSVDFPKVYKVFQQSICPSADQVFEDILLQPLPDEVHESVARSDAVTLKSYREEGTCPRNLCGISFP